MANSVAKAYADALFEIALYENTCEEFKQQMTLVKDTMNDQLLKLMTHPKIKSQEKKHVIEEIYASSIHKYLLNMLKVLIDRNRFRLFFEISAEFYADYVSHFQIQVAHVTSAVELEKEEKERLTEMLAKKLNQKVECTFAIDPELIAGVKVKMNDTVFDNTVLNRLTRLKEEVTG